MYHYFVYLDLVFYKYLCECIHKRGTDFGFFPICGKDNMDKKKREREREREREIKCHKLLLYFCYVASTRVLFTKFTHLVTGPVITDITQRKI
jgi:hypothetical protein